MAIIAPSQPGVTRLPGIIDNLPQIAPTQPAGPQLPGIIDVPPNNPDVLAAPSGGSALIGAGDPATGSFDWRWLPAGNAIKSGSFQAPTLNGLPIDTGAFSIPGASIGIPAGPAGTTPVTGMPFASGSAKTGSTSPGLPGGSLADYFARAIIVVLGFIFIAVGLNMLRPGIVPDPRNIRR